jgi:hypothetical protein
MANTLKKSAAKLQELATGTTKPTTEEEPRAERREKPRKESEVLIGASFPRIVRRSLAQLQTLPANDGKSIKDLLAEAINDLLAKYGLPETARVGKNENAD